MAATDDSTHTSSSGGTVPSAVPTVPSPLEARYYYYGLPSRPLLVARSSTDVWVEPTGPEAYFSPKELNVVGSHPLQAIWEDTVGPAMIDYLDSKGVKWTSLDPVRMGYADEPSPPVIMWMGVLPGSLSAEDGVGIATHCKGILSAHGIDDVHVEIRESIVTRFAGSKMYKPVSTFGATAQAQELFPSALGLPVCAEATPSTLGTGGFFISDPRYPGKIYLVTARHVIFSPDREPNTLYQHQNHSQPRRNVMLFGDAATEEHAMAIKSEISGKYVIIEQLERQLEQMDESGETEWAGVRLQLEEVRKAIGVLEDFLADISRGWKNRVFGHVVLSPPISLNAGEEGFTEDWAVIEIDDSKVNRTNFVGNVINLGTTTPINEFTAWMHPNPAKYPENRFLKFYGTISDAEMWMSSPTIIDHNDPCIMVAKRGYVSGLTVGCLNTTRSYTRFCFEDQSGQISKEVTVLPQNYKSGAFSNPGDSGSAVVDGRGRLAGLLTSGAGVTDAFDCTYVTSIDFLLKRMLEHAIQANLYPSLCA